MRDSRFSNNDVRHSHPGVGTAVTARLAEPLAALLSEHADLRSARLPVDDADDAGVGDKRGSRDHLPAVLFEEQHLVERDFLADLGLNAVERDDRTGIDPDLTPARLNDCE